MTKSTHKNQLTRAARRAGRRVGLAPGVGAEHALPTAADIRYIEGARLPPPGDRRAPRDVAALFTPEIRDELNQPAITAWFGNRIAEGRLTRLAQEAAHAEAVRSRMDHGAAIAAQIAGPLLAEVYQGLTDLMRDWEAFSLRFPQSADRLMPLRAWWEATHPGVVRPAKPANEPGPTPHGGASQPAPQPAPAPKPG